MYDTITAQTAYGKSDRLGKGINTRYIKSTISVCVFYNCMRSSPISSKSLLMSTQYFIVSLV